MTTNPKFNIGDIIIGTKDNTYGLTSPKENFVGKVVGLFEREANDIEVEVLECNTKVQIGSEFIVNSKYFKLKNGGKIFIFRK